MNVNILGLATASPAHHLPQDQAMHLAEGFCHGGRARLRLMRSLFRRSAVSKRGLVVLDGLSDGSSPDFYPVAAHAEDHGPDTAARMSLYTAEALPLAHQAAEAALRDADTKPDAITHIITCSCTGFTAPGIEIRLLEALGLSPSVSRTHVGFMGCHGSFNAMALGRSIVGADPTARVLICSVELCSLHFAYGCDTQQWVANALFADGAAAIVLARGPSAPAASIWNFAAHGSCILPDSADAMTWNIGNHGFVMTLSGKVPDLIATHLRGWLEPWLTRQRLSIADIGSWAIHPGGPRIVESAEAALGLTEGIAAESRQVLKDCGNMSSATILFVLQRLRQAQAPRPCVALGFGPGLAAEAMLFL